MSAPAVVAERLVDGDLMNGLATDLYELRMAASYRARGLTGPATFSLFVRRLPPDRGFLVAAGVEDALDFLSTFAVTDQDVDYLIGSGWDPALAGALRGARFTGDVRAVPEGRLVFADEPLLEVTAPLAEAQLVETALLNLMTLPTSIATKAARCRLAARGADLIDFSFRRTHGMDAAMTVARCSALAGFAATSNVAAARRYGLRAAGTMAHSYVEVFDDEQAAFEAFATDFPDDAVFLVDTYDTTDGVLAAIRTMKKLPLRGRWGIRLDSGDLAGLARRARSLLDLAGLPDARILASGGLDEYDIDALVTDGAPIDAYGVGTRMGVSADAPYLDSVYKLVAYEGRPMMKLSTGKATLPAAKQVFRGRPGERDVIGLAEETPPGGRRALLVPMMRGGRRLAVPATPIDTITAAARRLTDDLAWLPPAAARLVAPRPPVADHSVRLERLSARSRAALTARHGRHRSRAHPTTP